MEKEIHKQESWFTETPVKPTPPPARPKEVYVKSFPMTSAVTSSSGRESASLVFNWKEAEACIAGVFTQLFGQIDRNTQNLLLTNSPESHIPQNDGQHLHDDVGTGGSTPTQMEKNFKTEQPNNDVHLNKRPQQKPKVKKHRPKVVVDGKSKRTPKLATPKRTPKPPATPKPVTPTRASLKRNLHLSEKRKHSSQKASIIEDVIGESCRQDVIGESCRRALNFDLGNQSRDESTITTGESTITTDETAITDESAIHQYQLQLQNRSVDNLEEWPNKLQNDINLGSSYREPTDTKQAKNSAKGYCEKVYKRIFRCLRISREVGPKFPTSKRSKRKPACNDPMWMFPPRKTRTRVAVKKAKSFKCMLTLTQSAVQTRRKRSKRYIRRHNLASLNAIPICDQLPKTLKQAQTIERDGIAFCTENYEKQEFEIVRPDPCNKSEGSPLEDVDLWLIAKSRGPNAESESLRTDPIVDPIMESFRIDPIMDPIMESFRIDPILEHDALGVPHQVDFDALKSSEQPILDLNYWPIVDLNTETLCNGSHQIMEKDHNADSHQVDFDALKSSELRPILDLNLPTVDPNIEETLRNCSHQIMEKDHNADSTIVSNPIRKRKRKPSGQPGALIPYQESIAPTEKKKWRPIVDLDSESLTMWNRLKNDSDNVWNLLLTGKHEEKTDTEKENWWERERNVFRGRIESFNSRMHLILGDRRFKPWKGSVVDSVVGVFLTQNVTDFCSSSVFILLAARFPLQSTSNHGASNDNLEITYTQESSGSTITSEGLAYDLGGNQYFVTEPEPEPNTSHGAETRTETGTILVDTEDIGVVKDSVVTQGCCSGIHLSPDFSSEADLASPCKPYSMESSTTSTELSEFKNTTLLQESYGNGSEIESYSNGSEVLKCDESPHNGCAALRGMEYGNQTSSLDRSNDLNGVDASISLPDSQDPFENSFYSVDHSEILEDQVKFCVVTDCSSQAEVEIEKNSHTCNSYQEGRTMNFQSQPISFVDRKVESQNRNMQPADDATHINKKRRRGKTSKSKGKTETATPRRKGKKGKKVKTKEELEAEKIYWEAVRKFYSKPGPRNSDQMDSVDWEAVRHADLSEIVEAIKVRGQYNLMAPRIKEFLNRVVEWHGSMDLEWLRNLPPDLAKKYLMEINGLGLKSVECLSLLSLQHKAFPVDTNVARIAVRLGWVPLQPLPGDLQLHLLEEYPLMDSIQKYLWPRLCTFDKRTLYELHYHFITFGKAICTKRNPNCNACPMRAECKHFASAFASARLALPGPSEKRMVSSTVPIAAVENPAVVVYPKSGSLLEANPVSESGYQTNYGEPIIEEPASPEPEWTEPFDLPDIEDYPYDNTKEIPTIKINEQQFKIQDYMKSNMMLQNGDLSNALVAAVTAEAASIPDDDTDEIPTIKINEQQLMTNLQDFIKNNMMLQNVDLSSALVAVTTEAASIPLPKLKNIKRLRTEHQVYELPDDSLILRELQLEKRVKDDPSKYLLAIWAPGETANSLEPPKPRCNSEGSELCKDKECSTCNRKREEKANIVRGTILIPCRTATRSSFPLNGTYFQVNEVFADHETSHQPINVPRDWISNLPRRTVYFGSSTSTISQGLSIRAIQECFWRGNICVKAFDRKQRIITDLVFRLHCSPNKMAEVKRNMKEKKKEEIIDE